jgi:glucose-1-phosphate adenylyltransferase
LWQDCEIQSAIIGLRGIVGNGCKINRAMIMGADYYESEEEKAALLAKGEIPVGIGAGR